jgi:Outer membrane protein beta-barrel domain
MFKKVMVTLTLFVMISISGAVFAQSSAYNNNAIPSPGAVPGADSSTPAFVAKGIVELSLGLGICNGDDCSEDGFSFDPGMGINISGFLLINPNIAIGGNVSIQILSPEIEGADSTSFVSTYFGVEGRIYQLVSPNIKAFALMGLGVTSTMIKASVGIYDFEQEDDAKSFKIGGGINSMITPRLSVGGVVYYQFNYWDDDDSSENNNHLNYIYMGVKLSYYL